MWSKILKTDKWFHLLEPFMNETKNAIDDLFYSNISLPIRSTINTVQIMKGSHMLEWGGKITNEFGIRFWIMWILEHNQNDTKLPWLLSHQGPCVLFTQIHNQRSRMIDSSLIEILPIGTAKFNQSDGVCWAQ